jgi:hypothetical protein
MANANLPQTFRSCLTNVTFGAKNSDVTNVLPIRHILDLCVQSSHYVRYPRRVRAEANRWQIGTMIMRGQS